MYIHLIYISVKISVNYERDKTINRCLIKNSVEVFKLLCAVFWCLYRFTECANTLIEWII